MTEAEAAKHGRDSKRRRNEAMTSTCDACRKRKIKCVMPEGRTPKSAPCQGCRNLDIGCTYDYVRRKPGRQSSLVVAYKAQQQAQEARDPPRSPPPPPPAAAHDPPHQLTTIQQHTAYPPSSFTFLTGYDPIQAQVQAHAGPSRFTHIPATINDQDLSPRDIAYHPLHVPVLSTFASPPDDTSPPGPRERQGSTTQSQAWLESLLDPDGEGGLHKPPTGSPQAGVEHQRPLRRQQIEDVASWSDISNFVSLYMRYQYPLLPLVHRHTFAESLATRLDLRDINFRALLLSIVAFVISQLPTSRLVNEQYDIESLKKLQKKCHRTSVALQSTYTGNVTLTHISTLIFDNFYLLSIGLSHAAAARLGMAVQLAYSIGLHSDAKTAALNLDPIEIQLRRRVFWQLFASDKSRAIADEPMLINHFQGVCSYPDAIDDDLITSQGMFPQPPHRTSLLAGFVAVSRLFRILSECFFFLRCIEAQIEPAVNVDLDWARRAEGRVHDVLNALPEGGDQREVFAMQKANVVVTAAIVKFAIYDLRAALYVNKEDLASERQAVARDIHSLLMDIPLEDLAANGESVRAKILHIACALCSHIPPNKADQDLVKNWWNMFSFITFIQMPAPDLGSALSSRANTPPESTGASC